MFFYPLQEPYHEAERSYAPDITDHPVQLVVKSCIGIG